MSTRRFLAAVAAAVTVLAAAAQSAYADDIYNNLDGTVDATAEVLALNVGGMSGTTTLAVAPANGDGKNGCNLTSSSTLTVSVNSSDTTVATVTPTSVTFTACGDTHLLTVVPHQTGTATIDLTQTANSTSGTFNLDPARFTVNVAPPANSAPGVTVTGVSMGASYPFGSVPDAACSVSDAEDGNPTVSPVLSAITGPDAADGIGGQTATCSYTDAGGLTASSSATYSIVKAASTTAVTCSPTSVVYTGSPIAPCAATVTGGGGLSTTASVTYSANTNVGTVTASAAYAGSATHDPSSSSATFEITKADSYLTVTCGDGPFVYTGTAFTPCSALLTGAGLEATSLDVVYSGNVNAGTATASASWAGDDNHTPSSDDETFEIAKAPSTVTVTCAAGPFVFTGTAFTPCSATATGVSMADVPLTPTYANNTYPGTATASATYGGDANHEGASGAATFTINAWGLNGFYQPVDMTPQGGTTILNSVKGGSTVPLKFEIFSGTTELTNVSAVKSFSYKPVSCTLSSALDDVELTTTGGTSLRYDSTGGQFIQNWQTPKSAGACFQVTMTTQDNSSLVAYFKLK